MTYAEYGAYSKLIHSHAPLIWFYLMYISYATCFIKIIITDQNQSFVLTPQESKFFNFSNKCCPWLPYIPKGSQRHSNYLYLYAGRDCMWLVTVDEVTLHLPPTALREPLKKKLPKSLKMTGLKQRFNWIDFTILVIILLFDTYSNAFISSEKKDNICIWF